jgi:hypothetical protein
MNSKITTRPPRSKGLAHIALRMLNLEAPSPRSNTPAGADTPAPLPSQLPRMVVDPLLPLADAAAAGRSRRARSSDVGAEEMEAMLRAVIARLALTVDERYLPTHDARSREHSNRIRASVLECVTALERINQAVVHEFGCRRPPSAIPRETPPR